MENTSNVVIFPGSASVATSGATSVAGQKPTEDKRVCALRDAALGEDVGNVIRGLVGMHEIYRLPDTSDTCKQQISQAFSDVQQSLETAVEPVFPLVSGLLAWPLEKPFSAILTRGAKGHMQRHTERRLSPNG